MTTKLLFTAGSTRQGSFNARLAEAAAQLAEQHPEVSVTRLHLGDYDMPIYNGDLEAAEGLPANARRLKALFRAHHGFLIASPEYNSSMPPVLTNALHWISRPETDDEPGLVAFQGKVAGLVAASPGGLGGLRGLVPLRMMLGNIGVHVLPQQMALSKASEAFHDDGTLVKASDQERLASVVEALVETAAALGRAG